MDLLFKNYQNLMEIMTLTLETLQGSWETSVLEIICVKDNQYQCEIPSLGQSPYTLTIEETESEFKINNWVLSKTSNEIIWKNEVTGETVEWFRAIHVTLKTFIQIFLFLFF